MSESEVFRAFRNRNYQLYFWGRAVSQFGTALQRTAVVWMVYSLTNSTSMVGITIFAEQFPFFLFSIFGGVAADKFNRYKIVNLTQIFSLLQSVILAVLILIGHHVVWEILGLSIILGIINAFDVPARQAMMNDVVEHKEDLGNALSLNSAMASFAKFTGPVAAGIILHHLGAAICFVFNAVSFGAVMVSLYFMRNLPPFIPRKKQSRVLDDMKEGFSYIIRVPSLGNIILFLTLMCLFVIPYDTLLPSYAKEVFKGNASTYGYISAFVASGAVIGSIFLATLKTASNHRKYLWLGMIFLGVGLIAFSYNKHFALAMVFAAISGIGATAQNTLTNVIVQSEAPEHIRGRAISIMVMVMFGVVPIGSLLVGVIAEKIGEQKTMLVQGIASLIIATAFYFVMQKAKRKAFPSSIKTD